MLGAGRGCPGRFSEMLRANGHLLITSTGQLQLRLSLYLLHATLERAISKSLEGAIDRGSEGVERGIFRGPTLGLTNRWIHVQTLLAGTVSVQLPAFVLARKVEAALRASAQAMAPTTISRSNRLPGCWPGSSASAWASPDVIIRSRPSSISVSHRSASRCRSVRSCAVC